MGFWVATLQIRPQTPVISVRFRGAVGRFLKGFGRSRKGLIFGCEEASLRFPKALKLIQKSPIKLGFDREGLRPLSRELALMRQS